MTLGTGGIDVHAGNGKGGTIILDSPTGSISVNGTLDASAQTTGDGGNIFITASNMTYGSSSILKSDAAGNGGGGIVRVETTNISTPAATARISAKGGTSGIGGTTILTKVGIFDVNKVIVVDAGTSSGSTAFGGRITLNTKECVQHKTGFDWPKTYWNCVNPTAPTAIDTGPANVASTMNGNKALFQANNVQIYVFADGTAYGQFFATPPSPGGQTFRIVNNSSNTLFVTVSEFGTNGVTNISYSEPQIREVAAHEFGHAVDIIRNLSSQQATFNRYTLRDLANLDYTSIQATKAASLPFLRSPCSGTNPPFAGITNLYTGNPVCVGGVLNPAEWINPPYSNTQVLQRLESGLWTVPAGSPPLFNEAHAQVFAFQTTGDLNARPMNDSWSTVSKGHFVCMKAWANAEIAGNAAPAPAPGLCNTALPWAYTPGPQ